MKKSKLFALLLAFNLLPLSLSACNASKKPSGNNNSDEQQEEQLTDDERYQIYQLAVKSGYTGTYEEWLESIKDQDGKDGKDGDSYIDLDIERESSVVQLLR